MEIGAADEEGVPAWVPGIGDTGRPADQDMGERGYRNGARADPAVGEAVTARERIIARSLLPVAAVVLMAGRRTFRIGRSTERGAAMGDRSHGPDQNEQGGEQGARRSAHQQSAHAEAGTAEECHAPRLAP